MTNDLNLNLLDDDEYVRIDLDDIDQETDDKPVDAPSGDDGKQKDPDKSNEDENPESVVGKEGDGKKEPPEGGSDSLPNLYSSLAKALSEEGFLPDLKDYNEIDDFNKLGDKIRDANKKSLEEALGFSVENINNLTDIQKEYLKALNDGIPAENFIAAKRDEISMESITDEQIEADENLRKNIIISSYISKGMTEEKAAKLAQMHVDLAEDVAEAKAGRDELKEAIRVRNQQEFEYQKQLREDAIKQQQEYETSLKKKFYEDDKIGDTFDLTRPLKDKMFESIVKPVAKLEDGTLVNAITKYQIENPIDFQHKLAWIFTITDGFKKFDSFVTKRAMSNAVKQLESTLNSTNFDTMGNVSNPGHDDEAVYGQRDFRFDEEA